MDHQQEHVQFTAAAATAATAAPATAAAAANPIATMELSLSDLGSLQEAHSIL